MKDRKKLPMVTEERIAKLSAIGFQWACGIDIINAAWNETFECLQSYKAKTGHCIVPQGFKENPKLAGWVRTQRAQYKLLKEGKKSSATEERVAKLDSIGFEWACGTSIVEWTKMYECLKLYKAKTGHCNVPHRFKDIPRLGPWVTTQRYQYKWLKGGKKST